MCLVQSFSFIHFISCVIKTSVCVTAEGLPLSDCFRQVCALLLPLVWTRCEIRVVHSSTSVLNHTVVNVSAVRPVFTLKQMYIVCLIYCFVVSYNWALSCMFMLCYSQNVSYVANTMFMSL